MTNIVGKLGKRPAVWHPEVERFANVKTQVTSFPATPWKPGWGYGDDFHNGPKGWKQLGNGPCDDGSIPESDSYAYNGVGNCGWAQFGHAFMQEEQDAKIPISLFTCASTENNYAQYLGLQNYSQINANNDQGTDLVEALQRVASVGFTDASNKVHKIGTYASIEIGNLTELWEALYLFNHVCLGINFPESAGNQTNNQEIWSVVPGAQIEGGHCISLVGKPGPDVWTCITWGQRQTLTTQFIQTYMDEAYIYISPERYTKVTGDTPQGYNDYDLTKYLSML
ncbi:unnamed protein product [Sphagnum balticum]